MTLVASPDVLVALDQRLRAVAPHLLEEVPAPLADAPADAAVLLDLLVSAVRGPGAPAATRWLLLVALTARFPEPEDMERAQRVLDGEDTTTASLWLLETAWTVARTHPGLPVEIEVVTDAVVVDVNHTAHSDRHTGIQRVVRQTVPHWVAQHDVVLAAWTDGAAGTRRLSERERQSVLAWDDTAPAQDAADEDVPRSLLVPWRCTLVLPEVPAVETCPKLAAVARFSGTNLVAIGYDAIPVVSADLRPWNEPNLFVSYLAAIKYATRVAGISVTAADEFRGFSESLRSQGLSGPVVSEVQLGHEVVGTGGGVPGARPTTPHSVLCVGSQEVHKNHLAVMFAAERLWREGLDFSVTFVGRHGWDMTEFDDAVAELRGAGRPVRVVRGMGDTELAHAYATARFSIFPSLHEGYGLPVAEALASGTPVVTSNYGSMREIAEEGGCLLVDPRDDEQIVDAMRTLLVDDATVERLRAEAAARAPRPWETYASELWDVLIEGAAAR
ncbi:glycosyltransferase [Cellulomonas sp. NPDC055163]